MALLRRLAVNAPRGVRVLSASPPARDELDLSFNSARDAFKSKKTSELVRAYLVYQICSVNWIVENNDMISAQEWHIPRPSLSGSTPSSLDARSRGGSASSQGSSSNHSTHSVSSGSLLLSAANLARMNGKNPQDEYGYHHNKSFSYGHKPMASTVMSIPEESRDVTDKFWTDVKRGSICKQDATSVASSTHFTVVNGFTKQRSEKGPKSCCCNHSHQITVLVISMTILLSACILAAICFVEMRMRKETGMYKYS